VYKGIRNYWQYCNRSYTHWIIHRPYI